jgi:hypothetical protein
MLPSKTVGQSPTAFCGRAFYSLQRRTNLGGFTMSKNDIKYEAYLTF